MQQVIGLCIIHLFADHSPRGLHTILSITITPRIALRRRLIGAFVTLFRARNDCPTRQTGSWPAKWLNYNGPSGRSVRLSESLSSPREEARQLISGKQAPSETETETNSSWVIFCSSRSPVRAPAPVAFFSIPAQLLVIIIYTFYHLWGNASSSIYGMMERYWHGFGGQTKAKPQKTAPTDRWLFLELGSKICANVCHSTRFNFFFCVSQFVYIRRLRYAKLEPPSLGHDWWMASRWTLISASGSIPGPQGCVARPWKAVNESLIHPSLWSFYKDLISSAIAWS